MSQMLTQSSKVTAIRVKAANTHIFRALLSLASAALLARAFGMLNQVVVTSHFGAGALMDAYFVAYSAPTLVALLLINAIEASVIPVYTRVRSKGNREQISMLFSSVLNLFLVVTVLLAVIMLLFRQQVILFSAPGLDHSRLELASNLAPFIIPAVVLMTMVGLLECIFNAEGQFGWPAYAGLLVPLTTVVLLLIISNSMGVVVLCVGTVAGLCLQLCVFTVRAKRAKLVYRPVLNLRSPEIGAIIAAAWPALLGALIGQGSPFIDQIFASSLPSGSISALNYALKITSVFSGVIFASVGRAVLPYLSQSAAQKDMKTFKETLRHYWWIIGVGTTVLSIFVIAFAHPIVQILFQRGAFSSVDTARASAALIGFAIGFAPMSVGFITARAFSALGKTKVFIGVGIFTVLADGIFDYTFAHLWQTQGIALATSAVYFGTMIINFLVLRRSIGKLDLLTPPPSVLQLLKNIQEMASAYSKVILRVGAIFFVFIAGLFGIQINSFYTLRISFGSIVILALLRYRYVLLISWLLLVAVVGVIPALRNNNLQTLLIVPTLLLMFSIPFNKIFKAMPALALFFAYLLWVFLGIGISPIGVQPFLILWLTFLSYPSIAALVIHIVDAKQRLLRLIDIMLLTATVIALYGIYGYITKQNGIYDPTTSQFRIVSVFGSAPTFALFLSLVIPLAVYRIFTVKKLKILTYFTVLLILLVGLVLTFTRTTFITVPLSIMIMLLFLPSRKMKALLFVGVLAVATLIILLTTVFNVPIFDRFFNYDIVTLNNRTYIWSALLGNFDLAQLLGKGLGASGVQVDTLNIGNGLGGVASQAHNLFLGTLYDNGVIGLALLVGVFLVLAGSMLLKMHKLSGEQRTLLAVTLGIFVSVLIQSLGTSDIWIQGIGTYFWVIMALPFASCWSKLDSVSRVDETVYDLVTEPQIQAIQKVAEKRFVQI